MSEKPIVYGYLGQKLDTVVSGEDSNEIASVEIYAGRITLRCQDGYDVVEVRMTKESSLELARLLVDAADTLST